MAFLHILSDLRQADGANFGSLQGRPGPFGAFCPNDRDDFWWVGSREIREKVGFEFWYTERVHFFHQIVDPIISDLDFQREDKGIVKKVDAGKEIGEVWTEVLSKLASK